MSKRTYGNEFGFQTRAVHTGNDVDGESGAVKRPITMANSYSCWKISGSWSAQD